MSVFARAQIATVCLAWSAPPCHGFSSTRFGVRQQVTNTAALSLAEKSGSTEGSAKDEDLPLPFFAAFSEPPTDATSGITTVTTTERLPIGTLFDSREYIFSTAANIRGYEWTLKETDELFDDLTDVGGAGLGGPAATDSNNNNVGDYELSQIVLVPMEWDTTAYGLGQRYAVYDGQQRLVTLCLLLAALRESFRGDEDVDMAADTVGELTAMLNPPKVRKEPVLRIELRERDNDVLRRILAPELIENNGDGRVGLNLPSSVAERSSLSATNRRVLENYERLVERVGGLTHGARVGLLDYLVEHVYLLVCVPVTSRIARNIVMAQGKGMDNEPIDDFKGLVCFRYTLEEDDMYRTFDRWDDLAAAPDVESGAVGREIISSACLLRTTAALRTKIRKNEEVYALERWLRQDLAKNAYEGKDFFKMNVEPASLVLQRFRDGMFYSFVKGNSLNFRLGKTIVSRLKFLRDLINGVASARAMEMVILELLLRAEYAGGHRKTLTNTRLDEYLHTMELVTLWMALEKPSPQQRLERCFELLDAIDVADVSTIALSEEEKSVVWSIIRSFDFGGTTAGKKIACPLLERINTYQLLSQDDKVQIPEGTQHLEHVLPKMTSGKYWKEQWPNEEDRQLWMHRLGNLALVSHKGTAREANRAFPEKRGRYGKEVWPLTRSLVEVDDWDGDALVARHGEIIGIVDKIWGLGPA